MQTNSTIYSVEMVGLESSKQERMRSTTKKIRRKTAEAMLTPEEPSKKGWYLSCGNGDYTISKKEASNTMTVKFDRYDWQRCELNI